MKVSIISLMEGFPWGGSEELWYKTAQALLSKGHDVQICVKRFDPEIQKLQQLRKLGGRIVKRRTESGLITIANLLFTRFFKTRLRPNYLSKIEKHDPDVFIVSGGGTLDFFANESLFHFCQKFQKPVYLISQMYFESGRVPEGIAKRITTGIPWRKFYFVAERNRLVLQRHLAYQLPNSKIISNPLNLKSIGVGQWPSEQNVYLLACVARFDVAFKGHDILFQALASEELKQFNYRLTLYGSGPDEDYLNRLIKYFNLQDRVSIRGHVSDIDDIWNNNHVLVLASIAEGTPLALQEAMLKGRAALATDVGGVATLIKEGDTGFLATPMSVESLKEALNRMFTTPLARLMQMGQRAFDHARATIDLSPEVTIVNDIEQESNQSMLTGSVQSI